MKPYLIPAGLLLLIATMGSALAASGTVLRTDKLYSQPSSTASVAGSAAKGASVNILTKRGGWLRVTSGSTTGWIRLLSVRVGAGGLRGNGLGDVVGAATTRSDPSRVVAVAGLRGLNEEDLKKATFNADELARLEGTSVTAEESKRFARQAGLVAIKLPTLARPQAAQTPASSWEDKQ
ncbi:MAG: SH3 domain-containing protein [Thiobacillus sp.]|nr:SH3 domain-containing protein [Thiobacillus sp.]